VTGLAERLNVLCLIGGHPFDRNAFTEMLSAIPQSTVSLLEHPAATQLLTRETIGAFDALLLYDLPGLDFSAPQPERPTYLDPPESFKQAFGAALEAGIGIVALHHAIAAWPSWPEYRQLLGGQFRYHRGRQAEATETESGYRLDLAYRAVVADLAHSVTAGLPRAFTFRDELYLMDIYEDEITPLVRAEYEFTRAHFYSAELAVAHGRMNENVGWYPRPSSNVIAWAKRAGNSRLVYVQPGHGPETFEHPVYRQPIGNAVRWVSSPVEAWAS
jgi:type 1 glutamine amidotransferase